MVARGMFPMEPFVVPPDSLVERDSSRHVPDFVQIGKSRPRVLDAHNQFTVEICDRPTPRNPSKALRVIHVAKALIVTIRSPHTVLADHHRAIGRTIPFHQHGINVPDMDHVIDTADGKTSNRGVSHSWPEQSTQPSRLVPRTGSWVVPPNGQIIVEDFPMWIPTQRVAETE